MDRDCDYADGVDDAIHVYKKVINVKEFLEKILRQNVIMTENKEVYKKLSLASWKV